MSLNKLQIANSAPYVNPNVGSISINPKGAVTQITSISTGVTLNAAAGTITTVSSTLATSAVASFTVTNSLSLASSIIFCTASCSTASSSVNVGVSSIAAGSFVVSISNTGAATLSAPVLVQFLII